MEKIAENIRNLRLKLELTQQELADKISVSRSVLTKWESGGLIPDVTALIKLSEIFNLSLDGLVGRMYNRDQILREVRQMYQTDEETIDEEMLEIMRFLTYNEEIKKGLFTLSRMSIKHRKPIEEIMKVTLRELIK